MLRQRFLWIAIAAAMSAAACGDDTDTTTGGLDTDEEEGGSTASGSGGAGGTKAATGGKGGSTSTAGVTGSAGSAGGSSGDRLQSGTYTASDVLKQIDDCGLALEDGTFETTEIINTGTELSIGKKYDDSTDPKWEPEGYGLGSGPYTTATTATLTVKTHATIDDCEYDLERTTKVTYTGPNAVSVDFVDNERNPNAACKDVFDWTDSCQSHYTFDLEREE